MAAVSKGTGLVRILCNEDHLQGPVVMDGSMNWKDTAFPASDSTHVPKRTALNSEAFTINSFDYKESHTTLYPDYLESIPLHKAQTAKQILASGLESITALNQIRTPGYMLAHEVPLFLLHGRLKRRGRY